MSRTLTVPLRLNARGGAQTEESNIATLITLAVLPTGDYSPWAQRDNLIVPDYTWEADGPVLDAAVSESVTAAFARLERDGRARLVSVERLREAPQGQARFQVRWLDLETGATDSTVLPSSTGGA